MSSNNSLCSSESDRILGLFTVLFLGRCRGLKRELGLLGLDWKEKFLVGLINGGLNGGETFANVLS